MDITVTWTIKQLIIIGGRGILAGIKRRNLKGDGEMIWWIWTIKAAGIFTPDGPYSYYFLRVGSPEMIYCYAVYQ